MATKSSFSGHQQGICTEWAAANSLVSGKNVVPGLNPGRIKWISNSGNRLEAIERRGKYHSVRGGEITSDFERGPCDPPEWIVIEDNHPALIDVDTFEPVQRKLSERLEASLQEAQKPRRRTLDEHDARIEKAI